MTRRQLIRHVREFRRGILGERPSVLMCAVVCYPLQVYLSACFGVDTTVMQADFLQSNGSLMNHVWLRMTDGDIIDPTADQFADRAPELPEVYIGPLPDIYCEWMQARA